MKSTRPRMQRKMLHQAPLHKKRKWIASHLAENLLLKYDRRNLPVINGDTVKVMRGSFKGHEEKVLKINVKKRTVEIEGLTMAKADGNKIPKPIHASNLLITKLNLTDKWRRSKLEQGLSETTKKEIEKEAADQLKEIEQQRKEEERRKAEEEALAEAEEAISEPQPEDIEEEKTPKESTKQTKAQPKNQTTTEKKTPPKKDKKTEPKMNTKPQKKPATKKKSAPTKKSSPKKAPTKSKKTKEEKE